MKAGRLGRVGPVFHGHANQTACQILFTPSRESKSHFVLLFSAIHRATGETSYPDETLLRFVCTGVIADLANQERQPNQSELQGAERLNSRARSVPKISEGN